MDKEIQVNKKSRLAPQTIYEIISKEGNEELSRPLSSLGWSGLAAGICICFSVFAQAQLEHYLHDGENHFALISKMGYTFGFLIVVLGRLQLFTENTITVILPLLDKMSMRNINRTFKLWAVIFATNLLGTLLIATMLTKLNMASPEQLDPLIRISLHAVDHGFWEVFVKGIPAGFLIAVMVWMMPSVKGSEPIIIFLMIYLIALGDYSHVIAGSFEAFLLMLTGTINIQAGLSYILAAGLGNIVGGTGIFTLLAYAQIKDEIN